MIHRDFRCDFYFIRHGESTSNITPGLAAGIDFDSTMTERGYAQSRLLGHRLRDEGVRFDQVYASTLVRAAETARTMLSAMQASHPAPLLVPEIIEQQIPAWRGRRDAEVRPLEVQLLQATKGKWFVPADGESERAVERRFSNWLEDEILFNPQIGGAGGHRTIAIVSHGAALRCLFHYITGYNERFVRASQLLNCSISRFRFDKSGWWLVALNDASHTTSVGDIVRETLEAEFSR